MLLPIRPVTSVLTPVLVEVGPLTIFLIVLVLPNIFPPVFPLVGAISVHLVIFPTTLVELPTWPRELPLADSLPIFKPAFILDSALFVLKHATSVS